jgi:hypothetical protein
MLHTTWKILLFTGLSIFATFAFADDEAYRVSDDYYKNDIDAAIHDAKQNPPMFNYANKVWYKRTTAESFEFPPLVSSEMEETRLEGGINPSAAGEKAADNTDINNIHASQISAEQQQNEQELRTRATNNDTLPEVRAQDFKLDVNSGSSTFSGGASVSTSGIYSGSTLISSPRP